MILEQVKNEIEKECKASELLPWVEDMLYELSCSKEGKTAVRIKSGIAKELVEEALPLGIFAMHHFGKSDQVDIQHVLGSQSYDAVIRDRREMPSPFSFIEITQAHAGEEEHLRMLELEKNGHVNVLGQVQKIGTKKAGLKIKVENVALSHTEVLRRALDQVECAVLKKARKTYPQGTALLVVFDDYISIRDDGDIEELRGRLDCLLSQLRGFTWLSVVGWSKRTFLEFDLS